MSIDRAWSRRALVSAPHFGRLLPPIWTESEVTLSGADALVDNGHGGFSAVGGFSAAQSVYLTTQAHVEIVTTSEGVPEGFGPLQRRAIRVLMPIPDRLPQKGDTLHWTSDVGVAYDVKIRTVTSPETLADHLELESEAFD